MTMRRRLARGAGLAAGGFALSRGVTLASYIVIAQLISPREAGQFAAGTAVLGIALLFAESGMLAAVIQWREDVEEAASTAFASTIATGFGLTLLSMATAPLIGLFFGSSTIGWVAFASSGWLLLRSLAIVPDALLQRRMSFLRRVVVDPLAALAFGVTAIVLCSHGMGVWGLVIGTYAHFAAVLVLAWGFARWRPRRSAMSMATWRRLAGFARHVVASEVVRRVNTQLDAVLLGRFAGAPTLGQYSYGLRLASQPSATWVAVAAYVLLPAFARIAEDLPRFRRAFGDSLAALAVFAMPVSLLLLPLGHEIALLALGSKWLEAGDAVSALCLVGIGWGAVSISSEAFKALGRPQIITRVHLVSFAASVVLIPSLLWAEAIGVGIAVSAAAMIAGTYALRRVAQEAGIPARGLAGRVSGIAAAAVLALAVTLAADLTVLEGARTRWEAAGVVAAEALLMFAVFGAALWVTARDELRRTAEAAAHLRPKGGARRGRSRSMRGTIDGLARRAAALPQRRVALAAAAVCLLLGVAGELQNADVTGFDPFDLDAEVRFAALWSAGLLVAAAAAAWSAAGSAGIGALRGFGAFLLFMALDELFEIHEILEKQLDLDWQLLYLPVVAAGGVAFLLALRRLRASGHARAAAMLVAGAGAWVLSQVLEQLQWDGDRQVGGYEPMSTAEELLEMGGSLLFVLAMLAVVRAAGARDGR